MKLVDQCGEESSLKQFGKGGDDLSDDFTEALTLSGKLGFRDERLGSLKQVVMMVIADGELQHIVGGNDVIEVVRDILIREQGCQLSLPLLRPFSILHVRGVTLSGALLIESSCEHRLRSWQPSASHVHQKISTLSSRHLA